MIKFRVSWERWNLVNLEHDVRKSRKSVCVSVKSETRGGTTFDEKRVKRRFARFVYVFVREIYKRTNVVFEKCRFWPFFVDKN